MSEDDIFNRLLYSMVSKDEAEFNRAIADASDMHMNPAQLQRIMERIERWCRLRGMLPLREEESLALIKLQSFFRLQYVKKKLKEKYMLYCRLSMTDYADYANLAHKYHRVLKL